VVTLNQGVPVTSADIEHDQAQALADQLKATEAELNTVKSQLADLRRRYDMVQAVWQNAPGFSASC
jgi:septal ring factor EnvC (AmiA/AmiB activator)